MAENDKGTIDLAFMGDLMLGRLVNETIKERGVVYPWGNTFSMVTKADLSFGNLECALTSYTKMWNKSHKAFHFRADPEAVNVLTAAKISYVSLANNHVLDFREQGLRETLQVLDGNGITHAGAGRNPGEASRPARLQAKGLNVSVLSFTDNEPFFAATHSAPGTNYIPITLEPAVLKRVERTVEAAKRDADLVIFSIHWGPNMRRYPPRLFKEFAHQVVDFGADIFHGHSAHVFQGVETYNGKVILYDTGDFIDDYVVDPYERNDQSFLFWITVNPEGRIMEIELFPVLISLFQVNQATEQDFVEITEKMKMLCEKMGTGVDFSSRGLTVRTD